MNRPPESLLVIGGTPSGILTAVAAARRGLDVLLAAHRTPVGGVMVNGLSSWDTHFLGSRAPLVEEWLSRILDHYRSTYGEDSEQYKVCTNGPFGGGKWPGSITFEPKVAEKVFSEMLGSESRIRVETGLRPVSVERAGRRLVSVVFESADGSVRGIAADTFVDATYEGEVYALAGVPYRVGREARWEFDEQHAGRLFMQRSGAEENFPVDDENALRYPRAARAGALNLRPWWGVTQEIFSESTGEGDGGVQAYNFRVTLTKDPANRRVIEAPEGYDRAEFAPILVTQGPWDEPRLYELKTGFLINALREFPGVIPIPNMKCDWNASAIPGAADAYPDGDEATRTSVMERHRKHALGLLYFLQNDEAVPGDVREQAREWGLPTDEFADNENFPREIYIREARRMVGREIFTENHARIGVGLDRAPIQWDSIAISEWLMDSHDCSIQRVRGSLGDGFTSMSEVTRPAQVPWRCLLPQEIDNLVVSVAMSATHVGWGTLRVEPCLMHVAESVGIAVALAATHDVAVSGLDVNALQLELAESGVLLTFLNDVDVHERSPVSVATQFLGTRGFFRGYDARAGDLLDVKTAEIWARQLGRLLDDGVSSIQLATELPSSTVDIRAVTSSEFASEINRELTYRGFESVSEAQSETVKRGDALRLIYRTYCAIKGADGAVPTLQD